MDLVSSSENPQHDDQNGDPFSRRLSQSELASGAVGCVEGRVETVNSRYFRMRTAYHMSTPIEIRLLGEWASHVSLKVGQHVCLATEHAAVSSPNESNIIIECRDSIAMKISDQPLSSNPRNIETLRFMTVSGLPQPLPKKRTRSNSLTTEEWFSTPAPKRTRTVELTDDLERDADSKPSKHILPGPSQSLNDRTEFEPLQLPRSPPAPSVDNLRLLEDTVLASSEAAISSAANRNTNEALKLQEQANPMPAEVDRGTPSISEQIYNHPSASVEDGWPGYNLENLRGLKTYLVNYIALKNIRPEYKVSFIAVVSYVRGIEQPKRGNSKWFQTIHLVDPSNFDDFGSYLYDDSVKPVGQQSTWFSANHRGWLPSPNVGQIIVGHNVKAWEFRGAGKLQLNGYMNEYRWAVFDPDTKEFTHGDKAGAPDSIISDDGHGPEYSPFLELGTGSREYAYCLELSEWWKHMQALRTERHRHQEHFGAGEGYNGIARVPEGAEHVRKTREHFLLGEVNGVEYIDCTVRILYTEASPKDPNEHHYVYITDYTGRPNFREIADSRCPPHLSKMVLRVEMWGDEAVALGRNMQAGNYYRLCNTRVRPGNDGYLDGVFVEARHATKLEEEELATDERFKQLIKREEEFQDNSISPNHFEHKTVAEAKPFVPFDCTVEVLHAEYNENGPSKVFVTDYSAHAKLASIVPAPWWDRSLKQRIVKIELSGEQSRMAQAMERGTFFRVQNLTLKERSEALFGYLGGADRLLTKLNMSTSGDAHLSALLERKKLWNMPVPANNDVQSSKLNTPNSGAGLGAIRELKAGTKNSSKVMINAYIIDFSPRDLCEAVESVCDSCGGEQIELDIDLLACPCGSERFNYEYRLLFELKDKGSSDTLIVSADDFWPVLADLSPGRLAGLSQADRRATLARRLGPYIQHISDSNQHNEGTLHTLTVASCELPAEDGELPRVAYYLR